jgi:hypothetical protein
MWLVGCYLVRVIVNTTKAVGMTRKQRSSKAVWRVSRFMMLGEALRPVLPPPKRGQWRESNQT